jgi:glycosyltransferase 2 family protein
LKSIASVLIRAGVGIALLYYLLRRFELTLQDFRPDAAWWLAPALALLLLQPMFAAVRWWQLLRHVGARISFSNVLKITWAATLANLVLPAAVGGDALRVVFARVLGQRYSSALSSIVLDRLFALIALVALLGVFTSLIREELIDSRARDAGLAVIALFFFGLAVTVITIPRLKLDKFGRVAASISDTCNLVIRSLRAPAVVVAALLLSVAVHLVYLLALAFVCRAYNVTLPLATVLAIGAVLSFAQVVPISIGGWGVREAVSVPVFGIVGVEPAQAVAISLTLGLTYLAASAPGGIFWVARLEPRTDSP